MNDKEVYFPDQKPFIDSQAGRTYVPLRFVSEALGGIVDWNQDTRTAIVNKSGTVILMQIGSESPTVNGQAKVIDAAAMLMNDRTMVPLRFVSECLGATVEWDAVNRVVKITTSSTPTGSDKEVPPGYKVTSMGYVVPTDTKLEVDDQSGDINIRIMIIITRGDLETQFSQAGDILAGVHGREAAKEAVDYARKKTIPEFDLESKYFGNIRVYSSWNVPCIYIEVWSE
ncbi:MAG: copper amine oxidase N-terminal domain-containing protein [Bacillota bacterium]